MAHLAPVLVELGVVRAEDLRALEAIPRITLQVMVNGDHVLARDGLLAEEILDRDAHEMKTSTVVLLVPALALLLAACVSTRYDALQLDASAVARLQLVRGGQRGLRHHS